MEDLTKLESSANENKTEIKDNTTPADVKSGDFVAGTVLASRYRVGGGCCAGRVGEAGESGPDRSTQKCIRLT